MKKIYPKDTNPRKIGTKGRQLAFSSLNANLWEYHEITGSDFGIDGEVEFSHDGEFRNERFYCQIKGTEKLTILKDKKTISFNEFPVKTLNYALNSRIPFFLFLSDVTNEMVYFVLLNDELITNAEYNEQKTITIHLPLENCIQTNEQKLVDELLSFYK